MGELLWTIDVDAHVTEPPDVWTSRMSSAKWGDRVPRMAWNDERQEEWWYIADRPTVAAWGSAKADWPDKSPGVVPPTQQDAPVASYDANERLKLMDATGIAVQAIYPNIALLGRHRMDKEPELALEMTRVYNDFLIDWIEPAPDRFIPIAPIPYWDLDAAVSEVERAATLGHKGVMMHPRPQGEGLPLIGDRHWDPLWSAVQAAGLPISFHAGDPELLAESVVYRSVLGREAAAAYSSSRAFVYHGIRALDLLMSGVLPRFPGLKFFIVEAGVGWVPYVIDTLEYAYGWTKSAEANPQFGDLLPGDYFRRQIHVSFWYERMDPWLVKRVGADRIMFETDYPHDTALSGSQVQSALNYSLEGLSEDLRAQLMWKNAAELYDIEMPDIAAASVAGAGEWM